MGRNWVATVGVAVSLASTGTVRDYAMAMGRPPAEEVRSQLVEYRRVLLAYFKEQNLLPIILAADQKPGDVFDVRQWGVLRAHADECFPGLVQPEPVPSALAFTFNIDTSKANLALGLEKIASLGLGAGYDQTVVVHFTDVKVRTVSQEALRRAVSDACADVKQITDQARIPVVAGQAPPLLAIVGNLVTARREVFIGAQSSVDVKASADKLSTFLASSGAGAALKALGLDASASAALGFSAKQGLLVTSSDEVPIAFLPAFIPDLVSRQMQGGGPTTLSVPNLQWKDLSAANEQDKARLRALVDGVLLQEH